MNVLLTVRSRRAVTSLLLIAGPLPRTPYWSCIFYFREPVTPGCNCCGSSEGAGILIRGEGRNLMQKLPYPIHSTRPRVYAVKG